MKPRQINILNSLIEHAQHYQSIETLKKVGHCSEKTVRNDLDDIDQFIKPFNDLSLDRKRGKGISLQGKIQDLKKLQLNLLSRHAYHKDEILIDIAYHLLTASRPTTLEFFSRKYYSSSKAIKELFSKITPWLEKFRLKIISQQGKGTYIEGLELNKRNALAHLSELLPKQKEEIKVLSFFEASEVKIVKSALEQTQDTIDFQFTEGNFDSLMMHALIMIKRTRQHNRITITTTDKKNAQKTQAYQITAMFLEKIQDKININFPIDEIIYFSWHIASSVADRNVKTMPALKEVKHTRSISRLLIEKVEGLTEIPFHQDPSLQDSIEVHMAAVLKRLNYGFHISNPMLQDIKKLYPYMFSMVVFALHEFAHESDLVMPEAEAGFLVLHFQAAVERMDKQKEALYVLVVCHMGIGMSRLLEAKLEQQYHDIKIIACMAKAEIERIKNKLNHVDFIISTVSLDDIDLPTIVISPLLTNDDKKHLNQFIKKNENKTQEAEYDMLQKLFADSLFQVDLALPHPFEIIERMAQQLEHLGYVKPQFTHEVLIRERASATAIGGQIAIPHANPATVKQTKLSIALLKKPIIWGDEEVSIVILLAIHESDRHLTKTLLKDIAKLTSDPEKINAFVKSRNKKTLLNIFK